MTANDMITLRTLLEKSSDADCGEHIKCPVVHSQVSGNLWSVNGRCEASGG